MKFSWNFFALRQGLGLKSRYSFIFSAILVASRLMLLSVLSFLYTIMPWMNDITQKNGATMMPAMLNTHRQTLRKIRGLFSGKDNGHTCVCLIEGEKGVQSGNRIGQQLKIEGTPQCSRCQTGILVKAQSNLLAESLGSFRQKESQCFPFLILA